MNQHDREHTNPETFTRQLGNEVGREARSWLRWTLRGAVVGAVTLAGFGFWYFGLMGLWIGGGLGAVAGGLGAFFLYGDASIGL
jgi:hypothetical protein